MQGYDSVAVQADVELGGTDQKFNIAVGARFTTPFRSDASVWFADADFNRDGWRKENVEVAGHYVGLSEDPLWMYQKLEKTSDKLLEQYFELLTNLPLDALPEQPRIAKNF
jgi:tyrosyl-tRNA synthetase